MSLYHCSELVLNNRSDSFTSGSYCLGIDTLVIAFLASRYSINPDLMPSTLKRDPITRKDTPSKYYLQNPGLHLIEYTRGNIRFHFSAKLKGDRYFENLTIADLQLIIQTLQQYGQFNVDEFINTAEVHRCDPVNNLRVSKPVREYTDALRFLSSQHFTPTEYETGYRLTHRKHKNLRLTAYGKNAELSLSKNRFFLNELNNSGLNLLEESRNIVRVESCLQTFNDIREYLKLPVGPPKLITVLSSTANPNLRLFREIRDVAGKNTHMVDPRSFKDGRKHSNWLAVKATCEANECDPTRIRADLEQNYSKSNISKMMPKYLRMNEYLLANNKNLPISHIDGLLDEMESLLNKCRPKIRIEDIL